MGALGTEEGEQCIQLRNLEFSPAGPPDIKGLSDGSAHVQLEGLEGFAPKVPAAKFQVSSRDGDIPGVP